MSITQIINELSQICLEPTPQCRDYVHRLVDDLFPIPWLHHPLKAGSIISRCRRDAPTLTVDSFGCKPAEMIDGFQRASIYRESAFYAAGCDNGQIEYADFIAMVETSKLHREGHDVGRERIAVSHWRLNRDVDMALICHPNVFVDTHKSDPLNDMQRHYAHLLPTYPRKALIHEFDTLVEFVAGQFAKRVPENQNHQYMISAYFAHNCFSTEEGLLYPSVQAQGHLGFNVVIRPDIKEDALEFIDAHWCVLYKANNYLPVVEGLYSDKQIASFLDINDVNELPWIA